MTTANPAKGLPGALAAARKITGWYATAAVLFLVLGMLAIIEPALAALAVGRLIGWLLIFGGLAYLIGASTGRRVKEVILQLTIGITYLIGGSYSLTHPHVAIGTLTLLVGAVILIGGLVEITSYFRLKNQDASRWILFNGIVTFFLGGMIWFQWPSSSAWAIGILIGMTLLTTGTTRLVFALAARRLARQAARS